MSGLSALERRFLNYQGIPAEQIARVERITVDRVLAIWHDLKQRGVVVSVAHAAQAEGQLTFDQLDHLMRANRSASP